MRINKVHPQLTLNIFFMHNFLFFSDISRYIEWCKERGKKFKIERWSIKIILRIRNKITQNRWSAKTELRETGRKSLNSRRENVAVSEINRGMYENRMAPMYMDGRRSIQLHECEYEKSDNNYLYLAIDNTKRSIITRFKYIPLLWFSIAPFLLFKFHMTSSWH